MGKKPVGWHHLMRNALNIVSSLVSMMNSNYNFAILHKVSSYCTIKNNFLVVQLVLKEKMTKVARLQSWQQTYFSVRTALKKRVR